jgi:hypothetical protein
MTQCHVSVILVLVLGGFVGGWPCAAGTPDSAVTRLISQAGNAQVDEERLRILRQLRARPDLSEPLRADTDRMIAAVEQWVDCRDLTYFGGQVSRTMDYEFGIPADSPLYPLTCIYRGRMLVWCTLESGNILRYEDRRRQFLDKAVANFRRAREAFPNNAILGMYLGEPIPRVRQYAAPPEAPEWAALARENLERLADIIEWWIDHRMQPDGQFGGGWSSTCWSPESTRFA